MAIERQPALVIPTPEAISTLRGLSAADVTITGGFWAERRQRTREQTSPYGFERLERAGHLHDLGLAAGAPGRYQGLGVTFSGPFPFLDSDVYKWLEAVGWELGRAPDPELARLGDVTIDLITRAQRADGYINSFVQVLARGREYEDLRWGHELYCIGHLVQAAVAWHRVLGDDRLLDVASRAVESVERALGPDAHEGVDGHPEIEMALVELYRSRASGATSRLPTGRGWIAASDPDAGRGRGDPLPRVVEPRSRRDARVDPTRGR